MSGPELRVRSAEPPIGGRLAYIVGLGLALPATMYLALVETGKLTVPWVPPKGVGLLGVTFVVVVAVKLVQRRTRHRGLDVLFVETGIHFNGPTEWHLAVVPWKDIAGFKDDDREVIEIVRRNTLPRLAAWLLIPTPSEVERTAVLALLDQRGVKRLEA